MTISNTIGTLFGRDYATIQAWESATSISLSEVYIGNVYHDGTAGSPTYTLSSTDDRILVAGATNLSSTRYRILRAESGSKFDPVTKTGAFVERQPGATLNLRTTVEIQEDWFRFVDMAARDAVGYGSTSGENRQVYVNDAVGVQVKRCYLEQSNSYCDGTAGTASGDILRFKTSTGATGTQQGRIENCILVGGGRRGNRGATSGIRTEFGTTNVKANTIVDVVGHDATSGTGFGRGINMGFSTGECVGNLITRSLVLTATTNNFFDYSSPSSASIFASNVSADTTAEATPIVNGSKNGQLPKQTFVSWINQDYRALSTSFVASNQQAANNFSTWTVVEDYFSNLRGTSYTEIGAIEGSLTTTEAPPTIVVETIGSGGDYATVTSWETATRGNLVEANEVRIGEVLGEVTTSIIRIEGSQTDESRYRMLRPAAGAYYKPESGSGAVILGDTPHRTVISVTSERFFRIEGPMKILSTTQFGSTLGEEGVLRVQEDADYTTIDGCFFATEASVASLSLPMPGVLVRSGQQGTSIKNCTFVGNDGADNKGLMGGIRVADVSTGTISNCTVWGTRTLATGSGGQQGIRVDSDAAPGWAVRNCIAIDNNNAGNASSFDFDLAAGTTSSNNLSADATGDITGETASDTFASHLANNFYLRAGISAGIDAGVNLLAEGIRLDQARNGRNVPFDLGSLDGVKPYPPFPSHKFRRRVAHCFEIERRDGVRLQFVDNPTPVVFRGATWSPASFVTSARRREVGNKPMTLEISGGISSDKITLADLRSGAYQGARMTEYVIDWRYPHLEPMQVTRYTIEATTFDGEQFSADVQGLPFILKTKVGNFYGRTCRYVLGDSECRALITTEVNIPVNSVIEPRRSFYCSGLSSSVENYYRFGKLTWNSPDISTDVLSNKLVTVNQLSFPNTLTNAVWVKTQTTITSIGNGFQTGVPSYRATASGVATPHLVEQLLATAWTDLVPAKTKVCFSAYVKHDGSADHVELRLVNQGSPQNYFSAGFQHNGSAWVSTYSDASTTTTVAQKGTTDWYRISIALTHDGQQPDDIGVALRVGNSDDESSSETVQFARAQLEIEVLEPTLYTEAQLHRISLAIKSDFDFGTGDRFSLDPGCDKLRTTCKDKFANVKNFGGFPFVPGQDKMFDTPTQ